MLPLVKRVQRDLVRANVKLTCDGYPDAYPKADSEAQGTANSLPAKIESEGAHLGQALACGSLSAAAMSSKIASIPRI
ncbi:hypothetical protein CK228_16400 [Mesorhizobium sp. WSM4312]|nr:hypothetical protein CK228_16400 [Mesorhizobium sp. WSM4312]